MNGKRICRYAASAKSTTALIIVDKSYYIDLLLFNKRKN